MAGWYQVALRKTSTAGKAVTENYIEFRKASIQAVSNPLYPASQGALLVSLIVVREVQTRSGEEGVHDDEVGEGVRRVLHNAETRKAAPVLADQSELLQSEMIQQLPEDEAVQLVSVVIRAGVLVRLAKPYNDKVNILLSV